VLKATGETHKGAVRRQNQDIFRCNILRSNLGYAMVCDGMGGEKAGDIASAVTTEVVDRYLRKGLKPEMSVNSIRSLMLSAISAANAIVYEQSQNDPDFSGMGSTLVLAVISGSMLHIAHVGDSRIYMIAGEEAVQLTRDHSMVQMLVDRGELTPDEAESHPKKHYITRAVGVAPRVDPDYAEYPFPERNAILLCSDGLSNYLKAERVASQVKDCLKRGSARPLIDFALKQGGADNVTAVLVSAG
jgi:serine/threonine protein phosphatase PrpC